MTATGSMTLSGNVTNLPGSETFGPFVHTISNVVGQISTISLSSGANTVTVPSGTTRIVVVGPNMASPSPNPSYGGTLTIKGVSGDTGIAVSAGSFVSWGYDSVVTAPSTFVINASTSTSVQIWFW